MKVLFALCVLFGTVPAHVLGYCSSYELSKCLDGTSFEKYKNSHNQQLFVYHSQEELVKLCRDIKYVRSCQANYIQDCSEAIRGLFEGVQDAFHYMCEDGHNKYMRNRQCLGSPTLSTNTKKCETTLNSHVAELKSDSSWKGSDELKKEACGFIDEAKKCIHDYVSAACGNEAAEFEETFMNKMLKPLMAIVNCGGLSRIAIIMIVGACSVGVVIFISCLVVLLRRRKLRNPGHVIMPPNKMESGHGTAFENPLSG